MNALRDPLVILLTLPAGIALSIGILPVPLALLEYHVGAGHLDMLAFFDVASARSALSAIATGAMSALSLTYSLVLVVFTLAAGNIGPRLLKRFTSEIVNQITAGILGGTFLYAVATLYTMRDTFVPVLTIYGAGLLAILSVLQLIFFVRNVAGSVTIDDEVADISVRLTHALEALRDEGARIRDRRDDEADAAAEQKPDCEKADEQQIMAHTSGYVGAVDVERLVRLARDRDCVIALERPNGSFVLRDQPLCRVCGALEDGDADTIRAAIAVDPARSENAPVQFSVNLLVEIALRALSPGINDSYTAIACVDGLTGAFATIVEAPIETAIHRDDEGKPRVWLPGLSLAEIIGSAFHPIRRAADRNVMMMQALARAYARLYQISGEAARDIIVKHVALVVRQLRAGDIFGEDIVSVTELLPSDLLERIEDGKATD